MKIEFKNGGDPADPAAAIGAIAKAFEEFKSANDKRLEQLEAKGSSDVVTSDQVDRIGAEVTRLSAIADDLQKKQARPQLGRDGRELSPGEVKHREGFLDYMRKGDATTLESAEFKALSGSVAAEGGYAVPEIIDSAIAALLVNISPIRSIANVVRAGSPDYKKLVNVGGTASGWVGEKAARPETNSSAFEEVAPPSGDLYANPAATQNILQDAFFDVEAWVASEIAQEQARAEGAAFVSGNGTNKPKGFLAYSTAATADASRAFGTIEHIAGGSASALPTNADKYIDIVHKLKAGHRTGASWVTSSLVLAEMRKLKDSAGQYLWQPSLQAGVPSLFLGYPVVEAEDMPAVAANALPIAFGNFRAGYTIVDIGTPVIIRDPFTNKPFVHFYTTKRVGGAVIDSQAIKVLKIATS